MTAYISIALAFFRTTIGKWTGVGLLCLCAYLAGDVRGRRIEYQKCEAKARAAATAAVEQDRAAQKTVDASNASTMEELSKQKDAADARVHALEKTIADGVVDCVYDANGKPADGVRKQSGKGAGDAPASRASGLPTPRPRPAGH